VCRRQQPAGRCEEEPVGPRHQRTAGPPPEDGEFVPKHDDFQVLEIARPKAQSSELQNPAKHDVTEREDHEASSVVRQRPYSKLQPHGGWSGRFGPSPKLDFCTLHALAEPDHSTSAITNVMSSC
jgi:hypothetical protein